MKNCVAGSPQREIVVSGGGGKQKIPGVEMKRFAPAGGWPFGPSPKEVRIASELRVKSVTKKLTGSVDVASRPAGPQSNVTVSIPACASFNTLAENAENSLH